MLNLAVREITARLQKVN